MKNINKIKPESGILGGRFSGVAVRFCGVWPARKWCKNQVVYKMPKALFANSDSREVQFCLCSADPKTSKCPNPLILNLAIDMRHV